MITFPFNGFTAWTIPLTGTWLIEIVEEWLIGRYETLAKGFNE